MNFEALMSKFHTKREAAMAMGGEKKLAAYQAAGKLNARQRVEYLLDEGTWQEIGLFGHSDQPGMEDRSPCDGKIAGFGKISGRPAGVICNDLTVLGASSGNINGK